MELINRCLCQVGACPRWLLVMALVLIALTVFWVVAKLFKWALKFLLALVVVALAGGLLIWLLA